MFLKGIRTAGSSREARTKEKELTASVLPDLALFGTDEFGEVFNFDFSREMG